MQMPDGISSLGARLEITSFIANKSYHSIFSYNLQNVNDIELQ